MLSAVNGLLSIGKVLIRSYWKLAFQDFSKLSTKEILILGNGPSLNAQWMDIDQKRPDLELMVVNKFSLSSKFSELKPEHYVLLDGAFFNFEEAVFQNPSLHPLVKIKPIWANLQKEINDAWVNIMNADWPITIWIPYIYRNSIMIAHLKERGVKFQFFNYVVVKGFSLNVLFRNKLGMPQSQNVINAAIALSIWMKPENIYLAGLDHTFHLGIEIDDDNFLWDAGSHFYTEGGVKTRQKLININTHAKITMKDLFSSLSKVHVAYELLSRLAELNKSKIWNITEGGFVDAFQRKKIKDITKR
jgi:hypothetical protein